MPLERIQKILTRVGIASRRETEKMVIEGRVTVNGKVIDVLGFKADPLKDHIKVNGKRLTCFEPKITLLLNKPRGYLSTVKDPMGRPTVMDLLKKMKGRVYPVGRLDFDAEGLLLLTNDGDLTHTLSHPRYMIPRTYWVKVGGVPEEKKLIRLKRGVMLEDGKASVVSYRILHQREKNCWIQVVVTEGRNRLVKRIFSAIGHPVLKLKRVEFGPIRLGTLPIGQFRYLTPEEMKKLKVLSSEFRVRSSGSKPERIKLRTKYSLPAAGELRTKKV
ncbi:MAG: pseudouridine synthase [Thermodesulfobacteriota bacterium]